MDNKTFHYSYSPTERLEIEAIRKKYTCCDEEGLARKIKKLDNETESSCAAVSTVYGMLFAVIFGIGIALCIIKHLYLPGAFLITIGIIGMGTTPFVNNRVREKTKQKSAKKILELCDEYLKNNTH